MGKLRKTVQREVFDLLDNTIFTSDDFIVEFGDPEQSQSIIHIKFSYDESYSYSIYKVANFTNPYATTKSPGDIEEEDTNYHTTLQLALDGIQGWCIEIRNELKASTPLYSEIDKLKEMIYEHINSDPSSNEFSVEEINSLREKFEALEKRISELEKEQLITEKQFNEFKDGLERVTNDLEYYPKDTWVKTASNKLVKLVTAIGKSKEGRKILADGAKKLLGFE